MQNHSCPKFLRRAAAATGIFVFCANACADPVQWDENGHWYEAVYVPDGITWTEARTAAKARGGYLVCLTSTLENDFVYSLISHDDRYWVTIPGSDSGQGPWIGAYQIDKLDEPAGHWAWVSGEPWGNTNWAPGEPNNWNGNEDYGMFYGQSTKMSKQWNDSPEILDNGVKMCAYVVEYNTRPASTQPPETAPATQPQAIGEADPSKGGWDWIKLGSWALIGLLLSALVGMTHLWYRLRERLAR